MQTCFFAVGSALLIRAVDRGTALYPGEQRGTWPQLALGTSCLQEPQEWKKPRGGRVALGESRRAGEQEVLLLSKTWMRVLSVIDAFGHLMEPVGLLLETKPRFI